MSNIGWQKGMAFGRQLFTAAGQLLYATGSGSAALTNTPSTGQVLTYNGSTVAWADGARYAALSADVSKANDAALTNVTGLAIPMTASATEVLFIEGFLRINIPVVASDIKFGWTGPTSSTAYWGLVAATTAQGFTATTTLSGAPTQFAAIGGTIAVGTVASGTGDTGVGFAGWFFGGGTSGNIQLQYAQNVADAGTTYIRAGSFLRSIRLVA